MLCPPTGSKFPCSQKTTSRVRPSKAAAPKKLMMLSINTTANAKAAHKFSLGRLKVYRISKQKDAPLAKPANTVAIAGHAK